MIRVVEGELYIRGLKMNKRDIYKINKVCSSYSFLVLPIA